MHFTTTIIEDSMSNLDMIENMWQSYMIGIKITRRSGNLGVRGNHLNWGKNGSMRKRTSVRGITKLNG